MRASYLTAIFIVAIFCSCTEKIWISKIQPGSVPSDVNNPKYVLLVEKPTWSKTEEKQLIDFMSDYVGKWEMVALNEVHQAKYADSTKYRYLLKRNPNGYTVERSASSPGGSYSSASDQKFWSDIKDKSFVADQIFVDRRLKKEYPSTGMRMGTFSRPVKYLVSYMKTI